MDFTQYAECDEKRIFSDRPMEELQAEHIPWIILLGTIGMLMLIGFIGIFILLYQKRMLKERQKRAARELEYQNQMIQLQLESQEQERKRIGADLHDSLGSLLWGAKVNASLVQRSAHFSLEAHEYHQELLNILDESLETVRKIAWELTPEAFQYTGLSESIRRMCQQFHGKLLQITITENFERQWNDERALQVFRILQELFSNTLKHSEATQMDISLHWMEKHLKINVKDNGVGISGTLERKGVGLWNIEQRVRQLKAEFSMGNTPIGTGLEITMKIPLNHDA